MKLRLALLTATAAACLASPIIAHAQPVTGIYVSGGGGYNLELKQKLKDAVVGGVALPYTPNVETNGGITLQGSVGYGFGNGVRVEVEGDYFYNNFSKTTGGNGGSLSASGRNQKYGVMANALYDFNVGWPVYPYIGVGVGYNEDNFDNFRSGGLSVDKSTAALAAQGIVGLAYPLAPNISVTAEYRFFALVGNRKYHGDINGVDTSFKAQDDYNNAFMLGLRWQLFQPVPPPAPMAPAPMAAPAPAPAKTYLVFFDWDKASLTPRALDIIAQAASDSKTQSTTTIAVNGYTDTSGTAVYNQGLSVRRAKAVEAQLVTDGVPASEITAQGFGDTDLLVPTGPGVREPQNRRVQIVLQ